MPPTGSQPPLPASLLHALTFHYLLPLFLFLSLTLFSSPIHATPVSTTATSSSSSSSLASFLSSLSPLTASRAHKLSHLRSLLLAPIPPSSLTTLSSLSVRQVQSDGYNLAACNTDADCVCPRRCIAPTLDALCGGRSNCLCIQEETQLCNTTCDECTNYPDETCAYLPGDPREGPDTPYGVCVSKTVIAEGLAVEWGCDSFPSVTPIPEDW